MLIVPDKHIAAILEYKELDGQMVVAQGGKLLHIHLNTAVPGQGDYLPPLPHRTDGSRPEAHGGQSAGDQIALPVLQLPALGDDITDAACVHHNVAVRGSTLGEQP